MFNNIYHILRNDCPNCKNGKVFRDKSFYFSIGFPKMNPFCSNCNFKFEKEPGYFFGAMFVNYALGVGEGLITYFIAHPFFEETFDLRIIPIISIVLLLLSCLNIRLSRMIWIYLFKNYST
jgi:uncharacterized protein (DUF983 family)